MRRRLRICILPLMLFCCCQTAMAATAEPAEMLAHANSAFGAGDYPEAIRQYQAILATHGLSAAVLHNLGNGYLATGQTGRAILQYMRGLRLDPGDADLLSDLAQARRQIGLYPMDRKPVEAAFDLLDMNQWLAAALACYLLLTLVAAARLVLPAAKWPKAGAVILTAALLTGLLGAWQQHSRWQGGIVVEPGSRLLLSPFEASASIGAVEEGMMVFSEKQHAGFHYVRDERGRRGWLPERTFEPIPVDRLRYSPGPAEPGRRRQ